MSLTWRYVVRPDGSFFRVGNINGGLDNVTDEELARLDPYKDEDKQPAPPCSRCGGELLLHWPGPLITSLMLLELCPACDARRPAARVLIQWHRDTDRDPKALPQVFEDWETEALYARGWARAPQPEVPPRPAVHLSPVPREQD
ncbi:MULTISPECIES: DUF6300 family protein [unclassified Streptomyces]|uniref:DUF6300 family protein n=1 Tax=unclassified Streptomyces TaxID=2593676 RepID=UPI0035DB6823